MFGSEINAVSRIQKFLGEKQKENVIKTLITSNFDYYSFVWHFLKGTISAKN